MGDHCAKVWSDSDEQISSFIFRAYNDELLFFLLSQKRVLEYACMARVGLGREFYDMMIEAMDDD